MADSAPPRRSLSDRFFGGRSALITLFLSALLPCIPVIIVSALLLGLIFGHGKHIRPEQLEGLEIFRNISTPESETRSTVLQSLQTLYHGGEGYYLTKYNPSSLTTIAAWVGRVVPYLSTSFMGVVAFFVARRLAEHSRRDVQQLPSPPQVTILVNVLGGSGVDAIVDTILHRLQNVEKLADPVIVAFWALTWVTVIGFLIPVIDSWFGFSVVPVRVEILETNSVPTFQYGRGLGTDSCFQGNVDDPTFVPDNGGWPCSLRSSADGSLTLQNGYFWQPMLYKLGPDELYKTDVDVDNIWFLGESSSQLNATVDFEAPTYAIHTQCTNISPDCIRPDATGHPDQFDCTPGLYGYLKQNYADQLTPNGQPLTSDDNFIGMQYFEEESLSTPVSNSESFLPKNPAYFGVWINGYNHALPQQTNSTPAVYLNIDTYSWFMSCQTSVYDAHVLFINGTYTNFSSLSISNNSIGALFAAPFVQLASDENTALENTLGETNAYQLYYDWQSEYGIETANDLIGVGFGSVFSQKLLNFGSAVMQPRTNTREQRRMRTTVAKVPKVPLYTMLVLQLIYGFMPVILAVIALIKTKPSEAREIKSLLTVKGLARQLFDTGAAVSEVKNENVAMVRSYAGERDEKGGVSASTTSEKQSAREVTTAVEGKLVEGKKKVGVVRMDGDEWKFVWGVRDSLMSIKVLAEALSMGDGKGTTFPF